MTRQLRIRPVSRAGAALIAIAAMAAACEAGEGGEAAAIAPLTLAGDSASNPTVAYDLSTGSAYAAWVGVERGMNAVFVAKIEGSEGAAAALAPVRANDIPGDAAPHLQAPAQVAVGPEGTVYVLWQNNTPVEGRRFPASDLRLAVSTDGGRSFRPAVTVNDDAGGPPSSHTFHDMAVAADGTLYVSWIDSREQQAAAQQQLSGSMADAGMGSAHAHYRPADAAGGGGPTSHENAAVGGGMPGSHEGAAAGGVPASHDHGVAAGVAGPSGPEIRVARSTDGGRTFEASVVVDSAACPCCRTSLVVGSDGAIYVAWRKIFPGDVRDVVVARAAPGALRFSAPVRVHRDEWVFPGCPHAGPSLAQDEEGRLLVGWYTGREGRQGLWYSDSEDGGRSFAEPSPVLTADWVPPSQLRLAISGGQVWAAWDDRTGTEPLVRVATGAIGETLRPVEAWSVVGSDPSLAATPEGSVMVWLDGAAAKMRAIAE